MEEKAFLTTSPLLKNQAKTFRKKHFIWSNIMFMDHIVGGWQDQIYWFHNWGYMQNGKGIFAITYHCSMSHILLLCKFAMIKSVITQNRLNWDLWDWGLFSNHDQTKNLSGMILNLNNHQRRIALTTWSSTCQGLLNCGTRTKIGIEFFMIQLYNVGLIDI